MITIPNPSKADTVTLYEMADAAVAIGVSVPTLKLYVRDGKIEPIRIGRKNLFTYEAVLACAAARYADSQEKEPTPPVDQVDDVDTVMCPFCGARHPFDDLCGCAGEARRAAELWRKIESGTSLTEGESGFLSRYEALS